MRTLKAAALVLAGAAALLAVTGAGSASATALCQNNTTPCTAKYGVNQSIVAVQEAGTTVYVRNGVAEAACGSSVMKDIVTNAGGEGTAVTASVSALTFEECGPCVVEVNAKGKVTINHIAKTMNGQVKSSEMTLTLRCGFSFVCLFTTPLAGTEIGILTGSSLLKGATATIDVNASLTLEQPSNKMCNDQGSWEGEYLVGTPDYLDVSEF